MSQRTRVILFTDVKDSTGLLASADPDAAGQLSKTMKRIQSQLERQGGALFYSAGDGAAFFFESVPAAVHAACEMFKALSQVTPPLPVRVGIHVGDVARLKGSYYGLAVNVAARVQAEAKPGKVLLTSHAAAHLSGLPDYKLGSPRAVHVKGLQEKIELVEVHSTTPSKSSRQQSSPLKPVDQHGRSVVAVLPFTVQSEEPRWKYFADGFTEDLTANLSRFRLISVISSHSSFAVSAQNKTTQEVAKALGADYLVSGRMQVFDGRMRLIACLIEAESQLQIWAEKVDSPARDLFEVLDRVSNNLAAKLTAKLEEAHRIRIRSYHPESLESYELLLRGFELYYQHSKRGNFRARGLFRKAVQIDKGLARGYAALSKTYNLEWRYRWSASPDHSLDMALELANIAVEVDGSDARGHGELGFAHLYRHELEQSLQAYEQALALNPNDSDIIAEYADAVAYDGRPDEAVKLVESAKRLNPIYPDWYLWVEGGAYHQMHNYDVAVRTLTAMKNPTEAARLLASCYVRTGNETLARRSVETVKKKHPTFRLDDWARTQPFRNPADLTHLIDGMRMAGL